MTRMNLNQSLLKLIIKLLTLMILFVIVYMISALLYSARYWPDIYNYVNSNITIKRIPTLSELNYTIIEIEYTTEATTVDFDYKDVSTIDFDFEEFTNVNKINNIIHKRAVPIDRFEQDYIELNPRGVVVDYMFVDEETTTTITGEESTKIIKDLIDDSKLTTRDLKDVEILIGGDRNVEEFEQRTHLAENDRNGSIEAIFPWIVTIFIKNDSENNQFAYYCDGALLTETKILTAARCVNVSNSILPPEDILVVLGKTSLQQMADREKVSRINEIIIHESFTNDDDAVKNDLAVLVMDEPVRFTKYISPTNISNEEDFKGIKHSATTAWAITGRLEPVLFEKVEYISCINDVEVENAVCATYGYDVALCPSYGGLYAVRRQNQWQLEGIMSGNPTKRGICFNKSVTYTYLENYLDWIRDVIEK